MAQPDYLLCLECESPVYVFDWDGANVVEAICTVCGNEDPAQFMTESDFDELVDESAEDDDGME